ncbi:hypothetical protein A7C99_6987 [Trichophyton rubrum]|uniref:Uncharacterized protein n=1 Tax=Trichophyton rubrum TaxID=5551 RepID=A0A178EQY5_TRIRU|nr:hypothetical protein A7C99_6987 [Trichophyton rubrum]
MSASTERILPCPGATALPCARIQISTQSYPLASALLQLQDRALGMTQSERESRDFIAQCTEAAKEFNACRIVEGKDLASSKREAQDEHVESARPLKIKFSDAPDISGDAGNPVPERTSSK